MATQKVRPEPGFVDRQFDRQRRQSRNRRLGAIGLAAALIVGVIAFAAVLRSGSDLEGIPGGQGVPTPVPQAPSSGPSIVDLHGTTVGAIPALPPDAQGLRLSPDGSTIAFMTMGQVATIGVDGSGLQTLTDSPNSNDGDAQNAVSWSPDGTQIAFASSGELYVMDADGSNVRQLTTDPAGDYYPAWSPDGAHIAYWNGSTTGEDGGPSDAEIYTIDVDGGSPIRLTRNHTPDIEPAWSPDGSQIAYFATDPGVLRVMGFDGSGARALTQAGDNAGWAPAWSPDGARIAFLACCGQSGVAPTLSVRIVTVATGRVESTGMYVVTDLNGPAWASNDTLLVNRA